MKHLGIVIAGGFMARNILRTGVLEKMCERADVRVTLFVPEQTREIMNNEFSHERVAFVGYKPHLKRGYRLRKAIKYTLLHTMVWTISSRRLFAQGENYDREKPSWWFFPVDAVASRISTKQSMKKLIRMFENFLFPEKVYDTLLAEHAPDLLFSTSITTGVDVAFLHAAKRLGIPTISMTKGWDIFLYALARAKADYLLTQNEYVKQNAITHQTYESDQVEAVGFPQFDMYLGEEWKLPKEEVLRRMGLSQERKTIFFGSCGRWSPHDDRMVELLIELMDRNAFSQPVQIIVRPHFTDVHKNRYDRFRSHPHVHVDDGYNFGEFGDNFDVSVADAYWLANIMYHADALCIYASTLALDATMLNKPVIFLGLGGRYTDKGKDVSDRIYLQEHFQHILNYRFAPMVHTREQLVAEVNHLFNDMQYNASTRQQFKKDFLALSDGHATQRIADAVLRRLDSI